MSVPAGSGVLFSASRTEAGRSRWWSRPGSPAPIDPSHDVHGDFYVQGTIEGDDVDDDVPVTIDVFETGTTTPVGYEQADMPSVVDVGPSGFSFSTGNDLDTTTFSPDEEMRVLGVSALRRRVGHAPQPAWQPGGAGRSHRHDRSDPAAIPRRRGRVAGDLHRRRLSATFGAMPCSIPSPRGPPPWGSSNPPATLHPPTATPPATSTSTPHLTSGSTRPADRPGSPTRTSGRDLQVERRIALEVAPPAPGVDVTIRSPTHRSL